MTSGPELPPVPVEALGALAMEAAQAGAVAIRQSARSATLQVRHKSGAADLVTSADHAAEAAILQVIRDQRPGDAVLAEESGHHVGHTGLRWVVDPLDGTTNFVYGRPDYAVSVAVEWHGTSIAGAVVRPASGDGAAAWGHTATTTPDGNPVGVTATRTAAEALVGFDLPGPVEHRNRVHAWLPVLSKAVRDYRRSGSTACELLDVARGRQDAYLGFGDQPWDVAAGQVLVQAAGGRVERLRTASGISALVAGTPTITANLLQLVHAI